MTKLRIEKEKRLMAFLSKATDKSDFPGYSFTVDMRLPRTGQSKMERKILEKIILKAFSEQLRDLSYNEDVPLEIQVIVYEKPPVIWEDKKYIEHAEKNLPMLNKGPSYITVYKTVIESLQGALFAKEHQLVRFYVERNYGIKDKFTVKIKVCKE